MITLERVDERNHRWLVPDGWQQGRGAFGGLVLATLARAAGAHIENDRALRSVTASLCGPARVGEALITTETLRAGQGVTTIAAKLTQNGEVQAHGVFVFGKARAVPLEFNHVTPPDLAEPWEKVNVLPVAPPFGPVFGQHFEFRGVTGLPLSNAARATTSGWIRLQERATPRDAAHVLLHTDAWWPGALTMLTEFRPLATIAFTAQLLEDCEGLDPEQPFFVTINTVAAKAGYTVELREVWGHDGRLLALNQQTIVIG